MRSIAILAPGQMGASIGSLIRHTSKGRVQVVTTLHDRSARTRQLAAKAGIVDLESYQAVVKQASTVLSILPPSNAEEMAGKVVEAIRGARDMSTVKTFIDLNAISPATSVRISRLFEGGGVTYVDGGIIGGPATVDSCPKIVLSGQDAAQVARELSPLLLDNVHAVGTEIGQASALKLSYATLAKGFIGLAINAGLLAKQHGVLNELQKELEGSYPSAAQTLNTKVPRNVAKSYRWIGEMDEIAAAFDQVGLSGGSQAFEGISKTYSMVARNKEVGSESIEDALERGRTVEEVLEALSKDLQGV
ncbi:hypothetical protein ACM66B_002109 [Microbotryomycetes sp. NB124-2]